MPQDLVCVYECATGKAALMHSIDAAEAVNLGDYTYDLPKGKEPDPKDLAAARARATGMNATVHPELLSPEEREKVRAEANARAAQPVIPVGATVVMQAPTVQLVPGHADPEAAHMPKVSEKEPAHGAHVSDKEPASGGRK